MVYSNHADTIFCDLGHFPFHAMLNAVDNSDAVKCAPGKGAKSRQVKLKTWI